MGASVWVRPTQWIEDLLRQNFNTMLLKNMLDHYGYTFNQKVNKHLLRANDITNLGISNASILVLNRRLRGLSRH